MFESEAPHTPPRLLHLLAQLWHHLGRRRRMQYVALLILMLVTTFAEVVSLGSVLPFLGILVSPNEVFAHPATQVVTRSIGIETPDQLVLPLTASFALLALLAGGLRLCLLWASTRLAFASGADISLKVYRKTLYQPYYVHVARNSSEVVSTIIHRVNGVVFWIILPLLTLISSCVLLVAVTAALLTIDPVVAVTATIGFGVSYFLITLFTRKRLLSNGDCINKEQTKVIKALQEGLGGIRDVLLDGTQPFYCKLYEDADRRLRRAYGDNNFIGGFPRPTMEALGMMLIAVLAYILSQKEGGISAALPVLGALALGAQRLLPALQQGYGALANIVGGHAALRDTIELLEQNVICHQTDDIKPLEFRHEILLRNIHFCYSSGSTPVLNGFELKIRKGQLIGFVGTTGSGKSTAMDIFMGLLNPDEGSLSVDGQIISKSNIPALQKIIAHVPQNIFLADGTFAENIAFGVPAKEIDMQRVRASASRARMSDFVEKHPDGYLAHIGERGIRLSGGQRQRIGIARALYKSAEILVLDEATSALDNVTEHEVMESIRNLGQKLTVLIVAHRLSTVRECDVIYEVRNGRVHASGSFDELLRSSESFRNMVAQHT